MKRFFASMFVSIAILISLAVETVSEPTVICTDVEFTTSSFEERILTRTHPSIFQAWNPVWVEGVPDGERSRDPELVPFHDLVFNDFTPYDFPKLIRGYISEEQPYTRLSGKLVINPEGIKERQQYYFSRNPNFIHLTHWNFFEADLRNNMEFPADLKYWLLDAEGNRILYDGESHFYVNFLDPDVQTYLIAHGVHLASCGVFDGIMVDNFTLDGAGVVNREATLATDEEVRAAIIHIFSEIRSRARDDFLILVNAGPTRESRLESFTELINGSFMESVREPHRAYNLDELRLIEETLLWNEKNLRYPQINCLEGFGFPTEHPNSPLNQKWMRIFTTLSLTHSDGYVLYNRGGFYIGEAHHDHYWYDFWNANLGRPIGGGETKAQLYKNREGLFIREFTNGWAVYNRSGKARKIQLPEKVNGWASGVKNRRWHTIPDLDGEIYLKTNPTNDLKNTNVIAAIPVWDVNQDGKVSIDDIRLVVADIGVDTPTTSRADVNGDGSVTVVDLQLVIDNLDNPTTAEAPALADNSLMAFNAELLRAELNRIGTNTQHFTEARAFLQYLLASIIPEKTLLLANYPNPFNPETWIPYHLSNATEVTISIYSVRGTLVRQLNLGHQHGGYYTDQSRAVYWDGRNEIGERVASGIYFYQLKTENASRLRKMLILK